MIERVLWLTDEGQVDDLESPCGDPLSEYSPAVIFVTSKCMRM